MLEIDNRGVIIYQKLFGAGLHPPTLHEVGQRIYVRQNLKLCFRLSCSFSCARVLVVFHEKFRYFQHFAAAGTLKWVPGWGVNLYFAMAHI